LLLLQTQTFFMQAYLENTLQRLKAFSKSLETKSILIDQPWVLVEDGKAIQKMIFKKNGELILSSNGNVTIGSWEYLAQAKSLLIDRGADKILVNESFVNENVMVLAKDEVNPNYLFFANQRTLPNLDVFGYLEGYRRRVLNIAFKDLASGKTLEILRNSDLEPVGNLGQSVTIKGVYVPNGVYLEKGTNRSIEIIGSRLSSFFFEQNYDDPNHGLVTVHQLWSKKITPGDKVFTQLQPARYGFYVLRKQKKWIVKNGIVIRRKYF
jgi:hypothetical protein